MADKIYYDRDDLDEDEQKLFDQMVLEEMAKLENQFLDSSIDDERRDHKLPVLQLDSLHDDMGRDNRNMSSPYVRSDPPNLSMRSQPQHSDYPASMSATNGARHHSEDQQFQRSSRISLDAENYPRPYGNKDTSLSTFSPEKFPADGRQGSQEYKLSSNSESLSAPATRGADSSSRRSRQRDYSPVSRSVVIQCNYCRGLFLIIYSIFSQSREHVISNRCKRFVYGLPKSEESAASKVRLRASRS